MESKRTQRFCFIDQCSEKSCGNLLDHGSKIDARTGPEKPQECMTTGGGPPMPPHRLYCEFTVLNVNVNFDPSHSVPWRALETTQATPHIMRPAFWHPCLKRPWGRVRPSAAGAGGETWSCILVASHGLCAHRFWSRELKCVLGASTRIGPKIKTGYLVLLVCVRAVLAGRLSVLLFDVL